MSRTFEGDHKTGKQKEKEVLPLLKKQFQDETIKSMDNNEFQRWDFEGNSKRIELKFRTNKHNTYDTTMISLSKVYEAEDYVKKYDSDFYFCFYFTDKIMLIKYEKEQFKKYERRIITRRDRGLNETNTYVMIPVVDLDEINL